MLAEVLPADDCVVSCAERAGDSRRCRHAGLRGAAGPARVHQSARRSRRDRHLQGGPQGTVPAALTGARQVLSAGRVFILRALLAAKADTSHTNDRSLVQLPARTAGLTARGGGGGGADGAPDRRAHGRDGRGGAARVRGRVSAQRSAAQTLQPSLSLQTRSLACALSDHGDEKDASTPEQDDMSVALYLAARGDTTTLISLLAQQVRAASPRAKGATTTRSSLWPRAGRTPGPRAAHRPHARHPRAGARRHAGADGGRARPRPQPGSRLPAAAAGGLRLGGLQVRHTEAAGAEGKVSLRAAHCSARSGRLMVGSPPRSPNVRDGRSKVGEARRERQLPRLTTLRAQTPLMTACYKAHTSVASALLAAKWARRNAVRCSASSRLTLFRAQRQPEPAGRVGSGGDPLRCQSRCGAGAHAGGSAVRLTAERARFQPAWPASASPARRPRAPAR